MIQISFFVLYRYQHSHQIFRTSDFTFLKDAKAFAQAAFDGGATEAKIRCRVEFNLPLFSIKKIKVKT